MPNELILAVVKTPSRDPQCDQPLAARGALVRPEVPTEPLSPPRIIVLPDPGFRPPSQPLLISIPIAMGVGLTLILFQLGRDQEIWAAWSAWLPYGQWPVFGDLSITLQHLAEAAAGRDPLSEPDSEFAYPRAVLALRHLGLHHIPAAWLGLIQSFAVVIGIAVVLRPTSLVGALATGLVFFAPPMVLGFERANLDFALFLLCAASASVWARAQTTAALALPIAGIIAAAVLKLHPVFALITAIFVESGKRRLLWLTGLALLLAYWAINHADFALIGPKLPVSTWGSWGCLSLFVRLERYFAAERESYVWLANAKWPLIAVTSYAVLGALAYLTGRRLAGRFAAVSWGPLESTYFWTGAAICCGSFAGANIAYRWVFVLLTIPLLVRAARLPVPAVALWSRLTLAAIVLCLFPPLHVNREMFLVTQFANWSCILLLIVGCGALQGVAYPRVLARAAAETR